MLLLKMLSNPQMLQNMINNNPMLRSMVQGNPQLQAMLNDPQMLQMMLNPAMMQQAMQMMRGGGLAGLGGLGGMGGFPQPAAGTSIFFYCSIHFSIFHGLHQKNYINYLVNIAINKVLSSRTLQPTLVPLRAKASSSQDRQAKASLGSAGLPSSLPSTSIRS